MLWGFLSRGGEKNTRWVERSFTTAGVRMSEANTDGCPSRMFSWSWTDTSKSHACLCSTSLHTEISSMPVKSCKWQPPELINVHRAVHTVTRSGTNTGNLFSLTLWSSVKWHHVVWQIRTNVSEESTVSNFRAEKVPCRLLWNVHTYHPDYLALHPRWQ